MYESHLLNISSHFFSRRLMTSTGTASSLPGEGEGGDKEDVSIFPITVLQQGGKVFSQSGTLFYLTHCSVGFSLHSYLLCTVKADQEN